MQLKQDKRISQFEICVHGVPTTTKEEVAEDIEALTGQKPEKILLFPYKSSRLEGSQVAVVKCGRELYDSLSSRRSILIGYSKCRIDSNPTVMRCITCKVFGHTKTHCPGIPAAVQEMVNKAPQACLDCTVYNSRQLEAGLPKSRLRSTQHQAGSSAYPTRAALLRKYLWARRPEAVIT